MNGDTVQIRFLFAFIIWKSWCWSLDLAKKNDRVTVLKSKLDVILLLTYGQENEWKLLKL